MKRLAPPLAVLIASFCFAHPGYAAGAISSSLQNEAGSAPAPQTQCSAENAAPCNQPIGKRTAMQANATVMAAANAQQTVTGYYNIRSFGALGNGTDDETAAVQAAINAACKTSTEHPYGGVTLYFPAGFYPVHGLQVTCGNL